jgi:hypothetical protein
MTPIKLAGPGVDHLITALQHFCNFCKEPDYQRTDLPAASRW